MAIIDKFKKGLARTRQGLSEKLNRLLRTGRKIDDGLLEELEEALISTDMGVDTARLVIEGVKERVKTAGGNGSDGLLALVREEVNKVLSIPVLHEGPDLNKNPWVILIAGVNGTGKTTTIGKLAYRYRSNGMRVLVVGADTHRAAAGEQLTVWAQRAGADLVRSQNGADPAAVAFDALQAAQARGADVVIIDTAGRLHTRSGLMDELEKIRRVISKKMPTTPHEILLVLDATTGQNALNQAQEFSRTLGITGLVLTKLDGTARGGIAVAIGHQLGIPVKYIGVGEGIEDIAEFNPTEFVNAMFG